MIAAWMLWSIGVGLLLLVAGLAAEKLFEGRRRWVWATVGAGTVLVTAVRLFATGGPGPEIDSGGLAITEVTAPDNNAAIAWEGAEVSPGILPETVSPPLFPLTIPHDSVLHTLDGILLPVWLALSAGLALWALIGIGKLLRRGRGWEPGTLLGQTVLWSRDTGPAIVGLFRPRVVLPAWVADADTSKQRLILAHEEEHRRAGDGILRFAMATLLIAIPWNPFLWLHYRRLCLAIELDCDHRVVKRLPDRRWHYGDLLVRAAARRGIRPGFAPTAFADRRSFLEKRIGRLLSEGPEVPLAQVAFFAFAAIMVAGVAMWVPGVTEETAQPEELAAPEVYSMGFTNFYFGSYLRSRIKNSISPTHDWTFSFSYEFNPSVMSFEPKLFADAVEPFEPPAFKPPRIQGQGSLGWNDPEWTPTLFEVWENEPDAPLPVVSLPTAPSSYTAAYGVPPVPSDASVMDAPQYVYHTTAPRLANRWNVKRALEDKYPAALRDKGIGGTTVLYLFVNTDGTVSEAIVKTSSGHPSLDWAAVQAAKSARFLPASNEGLPVGIWIEMEMPFVAE